MNPESPFPAGRPLRCLGCGALVDPSDYPGFILRVHGEPVPEGCGGELVPALPGPVGE